MQSNKTRKRACSQNVAHFEINSTPVSISAAICSNHRSAILKTLLACTVLSVVPRHDVSRECRLEPAERQKRWIAVVSPAAHHLTVYKSVHVARARCRATYATLLPHCFPETDWERNYVEMNSNCTLRAKIWYLSFRPNLYNLSFRFANHCSWHHRLVCQVLFWKYTVAFPVNRSPWESGSSFQCQFVTTGACS